MQKSVFSQRKAVSRLCQIYRGGGRQGHVLLDASLATRELYLFPGHESRLALRAKNLLGSNGPDPGFSGFEYPLLPTEVFLELSHVY